MDLFKCCAVVNRLPFKILIDDDYRLLVKGMVVDGERSQFSELIFREKSELLSTVNMLRTTVSSLQQRESRCAKTSPTKRRSCRTSPVRTCSSKSFQL
jgi:hypothetical protein